MSDDDAKLWSICHSICNNNTQDAINLYLVFKRCRDGAIIYFYDQKAELPQKINALNTLFQGNDLKAFRQKDSAEIYIYNTTKEPALKIIKKFRFHEQNDKVYKAHAELLGYSKVDLDETKQLHTAYVSIAMRKPIRMLWQGKRVTSSHITHMKINGFHFQHLDEFKSVKRNDEMNQYRNALIGKTLGKDVIINVQWLLELE